MFYVTCTDGLTFSGKTQKCVAECESFEQAEEIYKCWKDHLAKSYVYHRSSFPRFPNARVSYYDSRRTYMYSTGGV